MNVDYEGVKFLVSKKSSVERHITKLRLKKSIGRLIGKPYVKDGFLKLAEEKLQKSKNPIMIDVGANIGTTTLPLAKKFPQGIFYAIEPHPLPASRFIQNCNQNGLANAFLINAAVAPAKELIKIYTCPTNSGGHRVTGFEGRFDSKNLQSVLTPTISLKTLFSHFEIPFCDVLKIDVEGFECQVLDSLENLLNPEKIGCVVTEYGPEGLEKAGKTGWDLVQMMLSKGFSCYELTTKKKIVKGADLPHVPSFAVTDFVFIA